MCSQWACPPPDFTFLFHARMSMRLVLAHTPYPEPLSDSLLNWPILRWASAQGPSRVHSCPLCFSPQCLVFQCWYTWIWNAHTSQEKSENNKCTTLCASEPSQKLSLRMLNVSAGTWKDVKCSRCIKCRNEAGHTGCFPITGEYGGYIFPPFKSQILSMILGLHNITVILMQ